MNIFFASVLGRHSRENGLTNIYRMCVACFVLHIQRMVLTPVNDGSYFKIILFSSEWLSSTITVFIFFHLFYQIYGKDFLISIGILKKSLNECDNLKITIRTTKIFSIMSVFFYMITTIFVALHHSTSSNLFFFTDLTIIISDITWTIAQLNQYLLWITRLYWTFQGSVHQSSNIFFYILTTLAIVFAIGMASAQILFITKQLNNRYVHVAFIYFAIVSIIVCIIDLILSFTIIYTFLSKLHELTAHCQVNWISKQNSDYKNDIKAIKMIKAECDHFKNEKKAFKKKLKQKTHRAKKKGIVIPSSSKRNNKYRNNTIETHSRILNDIAPNLSTSSSDDINNNNNNTNDDDNLLLIEPKFKNTDSTLISNIIATQTTMTYDDIKADVNDKNHWSNYDKSVWDNPNIEINNISYSKRKTQSVASKDESIFNFRIEPKLAEMERVPMYGHTGNEYKNDDNNDSNVRDSVSSTVQSDNIPYSIDSIYNPLNPDMIMRNNSEDTIKINNNKKDFAMIFEEMKVRDGRDTNSTTVTNATTNTIFSVETSTAVTVTDIQLNHTQLEEMIRSRSNFDKYRENLSLDDRQKIISYCHGKIYSVSNISCTQYTNICDYGCNCYLNGI